MENFKFVDIDTAIKKLERLKRENKKAVVCIVDFDKDITEKKLTSYDESCRIIRNGATIAHNHDSFMSHLEVFSYPQKQIENIIPKGIMHDILIGIE